MAGKKQSKKQQKIATGIFIVLLLASLMITAAPKLNLPFVPTWDDLYSTAGLRSNIDAAKKPLSVHFIDVGQGDCIFIKAKQGNVLIDSGERGNSDTIIQYLHNLNVEKLDYIVTTHPDSDHIGSMPEVIEAFPVSHVIMPYLKKENIPTTKIFEKLVAAIDKSGAEVIAAKAGAQYNIGDVTMTVLGPVKSDDEMNNMSVVLKIEYGKTAFLFTGDAQTEEEKDIMNYGGNLKADVLKAGHHGSKNSSGIEFLNAVKPQIVIISVGRDNSYKLPNEEALERFQQIRAEVFRTDQCGTIVIGSDGKTLTKYYENMEDFS